jgi:type IV pilus secretin PilQ/predicted competence protein
MKIIIAVLPVQRIKKYAGFLFFFLSFFCFCLCFSFVSYSQEDEDVQVEVEVKENKREIQETAPSLTVAEPAASQENPGLSAIAEERGSIVPLPDGINGKISLDLRNIDVVDALKFLAMKVGLNIISTKSVSGRLTLTVEKVSVKDVFDLMLRSNGLAFVKQGDIYNVMTEEEYKSIYGKKFSDLRQVKVFKLKYAIPDQAFSLLDTLKSDVGRVLVEPDSGTVLIMDTPANIEQIEKALSTLEEKNLIYVFNLKYAKAKDVEEHLKSQLNDKKVGSVKADERSNQVIVQCFSERLPDIKRLVAALDKKTKQVLIDTQIIKVKLSNQLERGMDWEGILKTGTAMGTSYVGSYPFSVLQSSTAAWQSRKSFLDAQKGGIGAIPFSGNTASSNASTPATLGEQVHIGLISKSADVDLLFKYLQTLGKTQILSNPKLAVTNNQEARIHIGEKQAYVTTTTTTGQTTSTVSEEVTFVDVGIQLAVTPTINDDNFVTMKIKPEISSVVSTLTTPSGNKIPIIDSSMAETTVMVKDGSTIVIGGLRKDEKVSSSAGVPFFSRIPWVGWMFQSGSNKTERTELLVMLTPHVIDGTNLTTGDEREFGTKPGKSYEVYKPLSAQDEMVPVIKEIPDGKIKPYREYIGTKTKEKNPIPTIKGDINE